MTLRFESQKGGGKISKAGKYKASKISALYNEQGQIQAFELGAGGQSDHKAIQLILASIPKDVYVTADRGYDSKSCAARFAIGKLCQSSSQAV